VRKKRTTERLSWKQEMRQTVLEMVRQELRAALQALLTSEREDRLAELREDPAIERVWGNGHYRRNLGTHLGPLENLNVPRLARRSRGKVRTESGSILFDPHGRRLEGMDDFLSDLYRSGISGEGIHQVCAKHLNLPVSQAAVGRIEALRQDAVGEFQDRPLEDRWAFLFLDGVWQKITEEGPGTRKVVYLVALGMTADGKEKQILGFERVDSEEEASWDDFLHRLKARGLVGRKLKLIIVDGNPALSKALRRRYPATPRQRCIFHRIRNVIAKVPKALKALVGADVRRVFCAPNRRAALKAAKEFATRWEVDAPKAVRCLLRDLSDCLVYFDFDPRVWKQIRTTNAIERCFREYRRRTRAMGIAPRTKTADRVVHHMAEKMNTGWSA
jgi:putative transposase